jgi:hypothetical protein
VATQHSLPSGRYSLLGPDFHRQDRTSLRLAHLFDYFVGAGEQPRRQFQTSCSSSFHLFLSHSRDLVELIAGAFVFPERVVDLGYEY